MPQFAMQSMRKDDRGVPIDPIIRMTGGGGGGHGFRAGFWVFPLPPDGSVEIFVTFPVVTDDEGSHALDGSAIRAAAEKATVIWS